MPAVVDLDAYQGDTWAQTFRFVEAGTPVDLTGATVESHARRVVGSVELVPLVVALGEPGEVTISYPATGALESGSYEYDVQVDVSGLVRTWVRGRLSILRDVTENVDSVVELELEGVPVA
jgi:hypothetical protein